jgi:hypothetical protein
LCHLALVWLLVAAAVVVENGALGGLPLLLLAGSLLGVMLVRGVQAPRHLDWIIVAACALGLLRSPGAHITAAAPRVILSLLSVAVGAVGVIAWRRPRLAGRGALGGALALWAIAGSLVIAESPNPRIDVFTLEQGGAEALLDGNNPYSVSYPNPYTPDETERYFGDRRPKLRQYPYPPLSLGVTTMGYALGGDVRWSLLAAELTIALLLFLLAKCSGQPPRTALGLAVLQLVHPRGTFVLEQAWTEGLVGSAFLLLLYLLAFRPRGWVGGAALGLFLASKQYSVVIVPLLWSRRLVARSWWLLAFGVVALVTVPLLFWGPADFFDDVVWFQLRQPARADAMSLPGLIQWSTGVRLPGFVAVVATLGTLFAWSRRQVDVHSLALAAACVYGVFFVAAKQAFCNYYYFLSVLVLAAAAMTPTQKAADG